VLLEKFNKEPGYNPNALVNGLIDHMVLKNDAALARLLCVHAPILSKVRNGRAPVTAGLLLRMHEKTKLPVSKLRTMMGVKTA
jgi:hypothetical protein